MAFEKQKERFVYWLAGKLPPCEAICEMASRSLEEPLTLAERVRVRLHFAICVWCERYWKQLRLIRRTVRETEPPAAGLSAEARERIKRALRDQA